MAADAAWTTRTTSFALTRHGRSWLVIRHRRLGVLSWELPGGHVEPHESLEQCAARETYEETGVSIEVGRLLARCVHEWPERRQRRHISFFEAEVGDARVRPTPLLPDDPRIVDVAWLDPRALRRADTSAFLYPLLECERTGWPDRVVEFRAHHVRMSDGSIGPAIV